MKPVPVSRASSRLPAGRAWLIVSVSLLATSSALAQFSDSDSPTPPLIRSPRTSIFFSPFPPYLYQPIDRNIPVAPGAPPPPELADYAGEIFYPQLGSRFQERSLTPKLTQELADYRLLRRTLLQEMREVLAATSGAEPSERRRALQTLAQRQAPKLATLEKSAEELRAALIIQDRGWGDFREWHLGDRARRGFSPREIASVMRAAAHYQEDLLPVQRRLLREISVELANAADNAEKAASAQPHVFFSPEMARVIFPAMSAELGGKLENYLSKKAALKKELYDTIYKFDGNAPVFSNPLRSLAEKQAPRFAELERLAEEIRVELGPNGVAPPALPRTAVPLEIVDLMSALVKRRFALVQDGMAKVEALAARARDERLPAEINYRFEDTGLKFVIVPHRTAIRGGNTSEKIDAVQKKLSAIAEDYGRALADLVNEAEAIREQAGRLLGSTDRRAVEVALGRAMHAAATRESASSYTEYRIAVFEPGLSPEQRRLLFDATIEDLHLPTPRGEQQPQYRGESW